MSFKNPSVQNNFSNEKIDLMNKKLDDINSKLELLLKINEEDLALDRDMSVQYNINSNDNPIVNKERELVTFFKSNDIPNIVITESGMQRIQSLSLDQINNLQKNNYEIEINDFDSLNENNDNSEIIPMKF